MIGEIISIVASLGKVVDLYISIFSRIKTVKNKEAFIDFFERTSLLIESVAEDLSNNIYPHEKCGEMQYVLGSIYDMLKPAMNKEEMDQINLLLQEAYKVEQLLGQLQTVDIENRITNLNRLKEISGMFKGAANNMRLK